VKRLALVRDLSPEIARCELSHLARAPIDVPRAGRQHAAYLQALAAAGCRVEHLAPAPDSPDGVFVEDTAVVLDELAVITRPGALSRRAETASVAEALRRYRPLERIAEPATLDGGDVLVSGRTLFVGLTARTSTQGAAELARITVSAGYTVRTVAVTGCLHLKSAVTEVADRTLLINPDWVDPALFEDYRLLPIDPREPFAANALRIGDVVIFPAEFLRTAERLRAEGIEVRAVEGSELAKAEGGVTCCSLVLNEVRGER
jgi:dimethylargininase